MSKSKQNRKTIKRVAPIRKGSDLILQEVGDAVYHRLDCQCFVCIVAFGDPDITDDDGDFGPRMF